MNSLKLFFILVAWLCASQTLAETVLTITGSDASGSVKVVTFDIEELKVLDQTSFVTIHDFVDEPTLFSGPLLRDLLANFTVSEEATLQLTALNQYQIEIPISDVTNFDVIVALEMNNAPMSIRQNGPLWVIYPLSDHPELQTAVYNSRMIWQLIDIQVR